MNGSVSLVAVTLGLLIVAVMLAAPWSTNATGQPAPPNAAKGEHKPAPPALLALPEERSPGAHRPENTTDGLPSTALIEREGTRAMFPGKPIPFTAAGRGVGRRKP